MTIRENMRYWKEEEVIKIRSTREEEVLKEVEGTAAMMGLTLDLRRESSFGEEKINLEETVKMETEKEQSKKSKAKKPRKPRRSLEPRVSSPESRPSPIKRRSPKPAKDVSNLFQWDMIWSI